MDDVKEQMKDYFLQYASYVILDRAIPSVIDGLKPVQRRILETLWRQHDDKFHKVANIAGQTMQLHPHGDAPIYEALVTLANKGYLLDKQGNFGNIYTGDPSAAARYIETKLSPLARYTLFNPDITEKIPSYDGRNMEPVTLPSKIPLLLMQGADGIAVGMSTHILPHNFTELLQAQICHLEGKNFSIFPDFPTGGIMDKSLYDKGKGKVKLRAAIEIKDPKTLIIKEICFGTTTESLIRSIDEAAKKGKIKIESIHDYTAQKVEIEIKLPRGQYAEEMLEALYGFTECEVSLQSQVIVIKDGLPWETDVHQILTYNTAKLIEFLHQELEIDRARILEKIFYKSLERIFIEKRLYKKIEPIKTLEGIHTLLIELFKPYKKRLLREPTAEDRDTLLQIPIRRISQFDIHRNTEEIALLEETLKGIEKKLKNVKKYAIEYVKQLIHTYGKDFPRKTRIKAIEEIDRKALSTKKLTVGWDPKTGFIGTKVAGPEKIECTNFDKLLVFFTNGTYKVITPLDKSYFAEIALVLVADKKTPVHIIYRSKTGEPFGKKFIVTKFILDKAYPYISEEDKLYYISCDPEEKVQLHVSDKGKEKEKKLSISLVNLPLKNITTKGVRLATQKLKKVSL